MQPKKYTSFWMRFLASALDMAILNFDFFILLYLLSAFWSADLKTLLNSILWILLYVLLIKGVLKVVLNPLLVSELGGSLGKLILGLKIEHEDGSKLTFKRAFFRECVAKIASKILLGAGYFWIFKNQKRQAWHDMLADTYVVEKNGNARVVLGLVLLLVVIVVDSVLLGLSLKNFTSNFVVQDELQTISADLKTVFKDSLNH